MKTSFLDYRLVAIEMDVKLRPILARLFHQWGQRHSSSSSKSLQAYPGLIMSKEAYPSHKITQGDEIRAIFRGINVDVLSYGPKDAIEVTNVAKHYFNTEGKVCFGKRRLWRLKYSGKCFP